MLRLRGAEVKFHDPHVELWKLGDAELPCVGDLDAAAAEADAVLLLQKHKGYDIERLPQIASLFFDTRGASSRSSHAVHL